MLSRTTQVVATSMMLIGGCLMMDRSTNRVIVAPVDAVDSAFDRYEELWRESQGVLASKLKAGEITSEEQASQWFAQANSKAMATAFKPLLDEEWEEFGGDKWTAEKQAARIQGYHR